MLPLVKKRDVLSASLTGPLCPSTTVRCAVGRGCRGDVTLEEPYAPHQSVGQFIGA